MYNVLIGCDQAYYDKWAITLLGSIQHYAPWVSLHCHIVNPTNFKQLPYVSYTTETKDLSDPDVFAGYLQAVRFIKAYELFPNSEPVIVIDTDSICTQSFTEQEFDQVHLDQPVILYKEKTQRWLAGFISMGTGNFRKDFHDILLSIPLEKFKGFWDQTCLRTLNDQYKFKRCPSKWMIIGKSKNSNFLTLKGEQKELDEYLRRYKQIQSSIDIESDQSSD